MAGFQLQMTWQTSLLLKKRKNGPPLGFKNLGNTCYLNAVLQCLTYTPPLANFCLRLQHSENCEFLAQQDKKSDCPFCLLEKRIVRSLSIDSTLDTPGKIIGGLKVFAEHFRLGRQEDAHEFLRYVIDACHTTCLRLKKLQQQKRKYVSNGGGDGFNGSTVVKEIFGGALQSQVKCLACGNESNKVDEIMDISVDVLNSSSLKEAFQKFFQPEILDGNNKYKCDNCKKLVAARKQMSIVQAPNILVIQLKRFEGIFGGKIDKAIAFEEVLVLSSFMCKTSQVQDPHPEYKLFATIVHSGFSPDSGHYYAYIKDAVGRWYCCNDSYVSVSSLQEVSSEKVYILFFSRIKQRPTTTKTLSTPTNGTTESHASKLPNPKPGQTVKSTHSQQEYSVAANNNNNNNHSQKIDSSTTSSSSSKLGVSGAKKFPNMKIIVHNKENNGDHKSSPTDNNNHIHNYNNKKKIPLLEDNHNGNGNGNENVVKTNGTTTNGNGVVKSLLLHDNKRKHQHEDNKHCKLMGEDHESLAKREELKQSLMKEACSFLRSCDWVDEVQSFMHAKKLCARDAPLQPQHDELKKKLIGEAKATFIPRVPEALKTSLIKHIRAHVDP
ncbi:unnamed protein product [Lactuca saligna]|uniref:Ubiquitin carboxyl-terminal hydrolase n=1 Tax=Lactuca saligna TaxID=75948 RepID=A0AA36EFV1_LACSI|nr:unnamed protein product [Lactuca saligna]